ncbi:flagellar hook assembly protein FlgD [Geodermatophilus sp. SYSU D00815]
MTTPVSGTTGTQATYTATTSVDRGDQMDKDTFLKLLVAQMRYQDPSNPTDPTQFMSQTAAFTQVEKLEELTTQNASALAMQRTLSAGAMVGRTVGYTDADGTTKTGVVTSVRLSGDDSEAQVVVGGVAVPVGRITEIKQPATS